MHLSFQWVNLHHEFSICIAFINNLYFIKAIHKQKCFYGGCGEETRASGSHTLIRFSPGVTVHQLLGL